tara:strand:- start:1243 stop:2388 length:1146 start_codon:yes stop_codon:yes gene_type:complete
MRSLEKIMNLKTILFIQTLIFLPFLVQGNIGSDWDSYASFASGMLFINEGVYIPSRPPGFPLYELIVGIFGAISVRVLLIFHFISSIVFTSFVYIKIEENKHRFFLILIFFTSHVYLISSYSVIDYVIGSLLGFLFLDYLKKGNYIIATTLITMSCAIRLSNLIFLAAGILFLLLKKSEYKKIFYISISLVFIGLFYYPSFLLADGVCFLNLTNINHALIPRLGRFFYKQAQFFGLIGTTIFVIYSIRNFTKFNFRNPEWVSYLFIFLSFELSFLRLPTEKGHLIPAMVALLMILKDITFNKKVLIFVFLVSFISNFITFELLTPDIPNHATSASFGPKVEKGYLLQDYENRSLKGENFEENITKSTEKIKINWSNGGPNC